jgi:hypothetical protein
MRPFYQQLIWTVLALGAYVSTFLVPGLEKAVWLQTIASIIFGAVWVPRPQEIQELVTRRRNGRESRESLPPKG